ncbi:MAG: dynamin family protein [Ilumatobacteraceae bacterium]
MDELITLVEQVAAITRRSDRLDLVARLDATTRRLAEPGVRVLVVGEFKQGKSMLINALIGSSVCPVDDDVATSVPTVVRYGPTRRTTVVSAQPNDGGDGDQPGSGSAPVETEVPLDELDQYVAELGNPDNRRRLVRAEVALPQGLLERGLVLVDTPGVGGIGSSHAATTIGELPLADAVLMVSDAGQEYSEPEIEFLRQATKLCPNVACVLTKIDLHPRWQQIAELDRIHLSNAGVNVPLLAVSSTVRLHALSRKDRELNAESGFPKLVGYLQRYVIDGVDELARRSTAHDVRHVVEHLTLSLHGERAVLEDPAHNAELVARLEGARDRSESLRRGTARWQTRLNDGMTDLNADIEYDLRDRTRLIIREAEELIDDADPAQIADQFEEWFQQRTAEAVAANFVWAHERSAWLADQVSECFAEVNPGLPELNTADTGLVLEPVPPMLPIPQDHITFVGKIIIGMRGSYGGVLMFGLLTGIAGFSLINPLSIGAGLVLGKRAYNEDRASRLNRRRDQAKVTVRRQIDDVILHVLKQAKDRLREVQRALRDHFLDVAGEMVRSLDDAINAANAAVRVSVEDRLGRLREIQKALAELDQLQRRAVELTSASETVAAEPAGSVSR